MLAISASLTALIDGPIVHAVSFSSVGKSGLESSNPGLTSTVSTSAPSNRIASHACVRPARMVSLPVTTLLCEPVIENSAGHSALSPLVGFSYTHASSPGVSVAGSCV